jgi:hypothetical protein
LLRELSLVAANERRSAGSGACRLRAPELPPAAGFPTTSARDLCGQFERFYSQEEWAAVKAIVIAMPTYERQKTLRHRWLEGDVKVCNCASCNRILLGASHEEELRVAKLTGQHLDGVPPLVAGRINGRPYCADCLHFIDLGDLLDVSI